MMSVSYVALPAAIGNRQAPRAALKLGKTFDTSPNPDSKIAKVFRIDGHYAARIRAIGNARKMSNVVSLRPAKHAPAPVSGGMQFPESLVDPMELSRKFEACRSGARMNLQQTILSLETTHQRVGRLVDKVRDQSTRDQLLSVSASVASMIEVVRILVRQI